MRIEYDIGLLAANTITQPATLTTGETDLYIVKNIDNLSKAQLTLYFRVTLGAVTSATFGAYYSFDQGSTWYPASLYNTSSGELTQSKFLIDSGTYATGGVSYATYNLPTAACNAFKLTGLSSSATPSYVVGVGIRNN